MNYFEEYFNATYDERGNVATLVPHLPEYFNFAYDVIDRHACETPDRPALLWVHPDGARHTFTFADIKEYSDKCANYFASLGIGEGSHVLVIARRHYQFWFIAPALNKLGAIMVPATFMLKEHDLTYRLEAAHIDALVCTDMGDTSDIADVVLSDAKFASIKKILIPTPGTSPDVCGERISSTKAARGWLDLNAGILLASSVFKKRAVPAAKGMLMYFSSGTSGEPKMVLHNAGYALAHAVTAHLWQRVDPQGIHFTISDTGWGKAVWGKYYGQWFEGCCVYVYDFDRFDGDDILAHIAADGITSLCCPPTMYRMMMRVDNFDAYDLSALKMLATAGEALNPDIFTFWKKHTGLTIYEGFGQTETPLTIANFKGMTPQVGSMGKPSPLYTIALLRDDGQICRPGETGEICIQCYPRPLGVMMEYYENEAKTNDAFRWGWYHTGDTAWVDQEGFFWYVGRNDDVIKSSGYRIGPFEIESVLLEHDAVLECAVTGVDDEIRGKAVKATIVLAPGFKPSDDLTHELQTWVKHKTAPYKYPRIIEYVSELPKTVNGKIRRNIIRDADQQ